jgi:acyl carrier protein
MEKSAVKARVKGVLAELLNKNVETISGETEIDDLFINSLDWAIMIGNLELEFKITIKFDGVFEELDTVDQIIDHLWEKYLK